MSGRLSGGGRRPRRLTDQEVARRASRIRWPRRVLKLDRQPKRKAAAPLDPDTVATTTYTVWATPTRDGWDLNVQSGGRATCRHLGEVEDIARERIVFYTGMPPERILLDVKRA